ncbi:MAG: ATP-binding protein, partial [Hylemonella sp.]|nr:ATP-binding protein [Hylemonella sp.]
MKQALQRLLPRRLVHQVALVTALLISISSASISIYFVLENLEQKFANLKQGIHALGMELANISAAHILIQNLSPVRDISLQAANHPGIRLIEFIDHDQRVLLKVLRDPDGGAQLRISPNTFAADVPAAEGEPHATWLYTPNGAYSFFSSKLDTTGLSVWHPIENGDLGWVHVEADTSTIRQEADRALVNGLLYMVIAVLGGISLIYLVFFYQFRSLARISRFADTLKDKNGQQTRVYTGSQELERLCHVLNDVSRQLHTDALSIELSHVRNDALFRNLKDVIISADEQGLIESVNPSIYLLLGYMPDELIGKSVDIIIPHQYRTAHHNGFQRYREDGEPKILGKDVEIEALHRDGHVVPIRIALTEYWTGTVRHFAATLHDLKDEIQLRQTERAREVAEAASQSKSDFLAHMSHEIRTPMNGVLGMVDVLMASELDERQHKLARIIRDSANSQLRILNDILDFSKIESGNQALSSEPFDLMQTLQDTCEAMQFHADQKRVSLEYRVNESASTTFMGDALRLRQILSNLISNAIKFSAPQASARVTVTATVSPCDDARAWLVIAVTDNGIGIAPEVLPALFQPFTQADSSTTKNFGGTGLGLAISQRLAGLMNGGISVESTLGQGSTFTVRLLMQTAPSAQPPIPGPASQRSPAPPPNPRAQAATPAHDSPVCTHKILVAEDNETNQEVIQQQLTQLGYGADIASDGQQAYELWQAQDYSLILSDIQMPRMDGRALATAVRQTQAQQGRP